MKTLYAGVCALAVSVAMGGKGPTLEVKLYADQGGELIGPGEVAAYPVGETVRFVLRAELTGEPGAYFGFLRIDLMPTEPVDGSITDFVYGDWAQAASGPAIDGAALTDLQAEQLTLLGPVDAANPLVLCEFDLTIDAGPALFAYGAEARSADVAFGVYPDMGTTTIPVPFSADVFSSVEVFVGGGPGPCNEADLAFPFGVLDLEDVVAFANAFALGDPAADLAPPGGLLDLQDVQAFVAAFLQGCP